MKKILLSSAAIVAFAGAASADISFSGSATLGYNDDIKGGVYADSDLDLTASAELNNGWTASMTFGFELEKLQGGSLTGTSADDNVLIELSNDLYTISYGSTTFAGEDYWSGTTNMNNDNFSEQDGEEVLKVSGTFGGVKAAVSGNVDPATGDLDQTQFGAKATFGTVVVTAAYQDASAIAADYDDFHVADAFGLSVATTFAGADVKLAYADDGESSLGLQASYPVGDVTLTAFYTVEGDAAEDDNYGVEVAYAANGVTAKVWYHDGSDEDMGINLSYAVSDELSVYAGYSDDDGQYLGAEYDLGGGASIVAAYAEDDNNAANDEIGPQEYLHGTTVALSLSF